MSEEGNLVLQIRLLRPTKRGVKKEAAGSRGADSRVRIELMIAHVLLCMSEFGGS